MTTVYLKHMRLLILLGSLTFAKAQQPSTVVRPPGTHWETQVFTPPQPNHLDTLGFGTTLAADGDLAIVGHPHDPTDGKDAGFLYTFDLADGGFWRRGPDLSIKGPRTTHQLGYMTAISGHRFAAAIRDRAETPFIGVLRGFARDAESLTWQEGPHHISPNQATQPFGYGTQIAMEDNVMVIGQGIPHPHAVHVYVCTDEHQWTHQHSLPIQPAHSLILHRKQLIFGTGKEVFIYRNWEHAQVLRSPFTPGAFGQALAADGDDLYIADPYVAYQERIGVIHHYTFINGQYQRVGTIPAPIPVVHPTFGHSLAAQKGLLAVGMLGHNSPGRHHGAVALYQKSTTPPAATPQLIAYLAPSQGDYREGFSHALAFAGTDHLLVSAPQANRLHTYHLPPILEAAAKGNRPPLVLAIIHIWPHPRRLNQPPIFALDGNHHTYSHLTEHLNRQPFTVAVTLTQPRLVSQLHLHEASHYGGHEHLAIDVLYANPSDSSPIQKRQLLPVENLTTTRRDTSEATCLTTHSFTPILTNAIALRVRFKGNLQSAHQPLHYHLREIQLFSPARSAP